MKHFIYLFIFFFSLVTNKLYAQGNIKKFTTKSTIKALERKYV